MLPWLAEATSLAPTMPQCTVGKCCYHRDLHRMRGHFVDEGRVSEGRDRHLVTAWLTGPTSEGTGLPEPLQEPKGRYLSGQASAHQREGGRVEQVCSPCQLA